LYSAIDIDGQPLSSSYVRIGSKASWRMKASIFFTSSPVSQLGLACDGVAA
jgi:hypothetical protein